MPDYGWAYINLDVLKTIDAPPSVTGTIGIIKDQFTLSGSKFLAFATASKKVGIGLNFPTVVPSYQLDVSASVSETTAARFVGDIQVSGNAFISGNLNVNHLIADTVISSSNLIISDTVIGLGFGDPMTNTTGSVGDRGMVFGLEGNLNQAILWDQSSGSFVMGKVASQGPEAKAFDITEPNLGSLRLGQLTGTAGVSGALGQFDSLSVGTTLTTLSAMSGASDLKVGGSITGSDTIYIEASTDRVGIRRPLPNAVLHLSQSGATDNEGKPMLVIETPGVRAGKQQKKPVFIVTSSMPDDYNEGRVGINTDDPSGVLHVKSKLDGEDGKDTLVIHDNKMVVGDTNANAKLAVHNNKDTNNILRIDTTNDDDFRYGLFYISGTTDSTKAGFFGSDASGSALVVSGSSFLTNVTASVGISGSAGIFHEINTDRITIASIAATGGTIDNVPIGGTTTAAGAFTTITGSSTLKIHGDITGSDTLYVSSVNDRVGINAGAPEGELHVKSEGSDALLVKQGNVSIGTTDTNAQLYVNAQNDNMFQVRHSGGGGTELLFVSGSGRVGLGTTSPGSLLDVRGNISASSTLEIHGDITGSDTLYINAETDRVGIRRKLPNAVLHLSQSGATDNEGKPMLLIETPGAAAGKQQPKPVFIVTSSIPDDYSEGRVGINTDDPSGVLHIKSKLDGESGKNTLVVHDNKVVIGDTNANAKFAIHNNKDTNNILRIDTTNDDDFRYGLFYISGSGDSSKAGFFGSDASGSALVVSGSSFLTNVTASVGISGSAGIFHELVSDRITLASIAATGGSIDNTTIGGTTAADATVNKLTQTAGLVKYRSKDNGDSPYTVAASDYIIGVDTSGGAVQINLQAAGTAGTGRMLIIKDIKGTAGSNNITIEPNGSEKIDRQANLIIAANSGSVILFCDGSEYFIAGTR